MAQIKVSPKALEQDATTLATMNADLKKRFRRLLRWKTVSVRCGKVLQEMNSTTFSRKTTNR